MTTRKPKSEWKRNGRPPVIDETVLGKLEDAFMNAFTDEMACLYAGINPDTLYEYCKKHPKFTERKERLKITPNLRAQQVIIKDIENVGGARYWAERRMREFMPKQGLVLGGKIETEDTSVKEAIREVASKYEEELKRTIAATHKKT